MIAKAKIRPFATGTQYAAWYSRNCAGCRKRWREENPSAIPCEIDAAFLVAYWHDGTVAHEIAERCGYYDAQGAYVWDCPEREP